MAKKSTTQPTHTHPWLAAPEPTERRLQVYSIDPSAGCYVGNRMTLEVPWEPLEVGPVGKRLAVIDYDASNKRYYSPIDLEDPYLLATNGMVPSESDPRFHQQMVYAVASQTIEMFEVALGRSIHWRRADRSPDGPDNADTWRKSDDIKVLHLFPHAMQEANAYYSPQAHGILFGYFKANETGQGKNLPGQRVFTCLSHDIIAHEVTHAVIDGIRTYFTEASNPDVLAFHEGFADIAALLSHFSQKDELIGTIQRTGGLLYSADMPGDVPVGGGANQGTLSGQVRVDNPLIQLAQQFGEARGAGHALRSALGTPADPSLLQKSKNDPHLRGSILVAAVFDAYFTVYSRESAPLFQIHRAAGIGTGGDSLPYQMADQLAQIASKLATRFFKLCARALDYCPPVDVTFGDFLRALITISSDVDPGDSAGIRDALMQSFRLRGIYPESASFFSEDALRWPPVVPGTLKPIKPVTIKHPRTRRKAIKALIFGSPNGLTSEERDINGAVLRQYVSENAAALGLDPSLPFSVPSLHPMFQVTGKGKLREEMVVEVVQTRKASFGPGMPDAGSFPFRGGFTLIISAPGLETLKGKVVATFPEVRFVIGKPIHGDAGEKREQTQRQYSLNLGLAAGNTEEPTHFQANFALLHEGV